MDPIDLLCLGEALVEFNERDPGVWHQGVGGDTLNVAVAAARAGARVGYATALGADRWGDTILTRCKKEGIDTSAITRDKDRDTGLYFVRHDTEGHYFSYRRTESAATCYAPSPTLDFELSRCRMLHLSGITLAIAQPQLIQHSLATAKAAGAEISFDLNYRALLWPPERAREPILAAMRMSDILLPGLDDLSSLFNIRDIDEAIAFCLEQTNLVVLKNGKNDVIVADHTDRHAITPPTVTPQDANGAGDCFAGTFLAELARGIAPIAAAQSAAMAAALSTTTFGAQS
jgi:2-dehydro-3-deoxygluconokinase